MTREEEEDEGVRRTPFFALQKEFFSQAHKIFVYR